MEFEVLGPLAASVDLPSAAQPRRLLAVLLAKPNEFVHRDALVDELWPEGAPLSAAAIVQVTVSKLRKCSRRGWNPAVPSSGPLGYRLTVEDGELDAAEFLSLAAAEGTASDLDQRHDLLEGALKRWRGPAFDDVSGGPLVEAHKVWLNDRRWSVFRKAIAIDLERGRHRTVVDRLAQVVADRPTDEQLIVALDRCGRRDAALESLRRARQALWEQAGVRPGPELFTLYHRIAGREWITGVPTAPLPAPMPVFFGRTRLLAELAALRGRKRFPDGQLIRGSSDGPTGRLRSHETR